MTEASILLVVDIRIEENDWLADLPDVEVLATRALEAAAGRMGVSGSVDLLFTSDEKMRVMNQQWRDKDKPTDVLSFPSGSDQSPPGAQRFFGDLALGLGVAKIDADKLNRSFGLHVMHLLVHGFLHLLGHDHISPSDANLMEGLEAEILAPLGLPDPYGDSA